MDSQFQVDKKLSAEHDLSKGERSYLKEQGISVDQFNRLDSTSQNEWKEECKNPHYETMRKYGFKRKYL